MRRQRGQWLERAEEPSRRSPPDPHDDEDDFPKRDERATALAKEGQLSKACTALLNEPLASYSESVAKEMRDRRRRGQYEALLGRKTVGVPSATDQRRAHPGYRNESVFGIMAEGTFYTPSCPVVDGIEDKDVSHRPAVGETLRRLTAKALLATTRHSWGSGPRTALRPSYMPSDDGFNGTETKDYAF